VHIPSHARFLAKVEIPSPMITLSHKRPFIKRSK